jgi:hypothetical protein
MSLQLFSEPLPRAVLISIVGLLFVSAIYFLWVRKRSRQPVE